MSSVIGCALMLAFATIVLLLVAYRQSYIVKVTWRYAAIILPFVFAAAIKCLSKSPVNMTTTPAPVAPTAVYGIKDQLAEAHLISAIEATAAREDNKIKLEVLRKVTQIEDSGERRRKLAELMG